MRNFSFWTAVVAILTFVVLLDVGNCQTQNGEQQNQGNAWSGLWKSWTGSTGNGATSTTGGGMPQWLGLADQFMSNWMTNFASRRNAAKANGTNQSGGFFASLMDGIVSFGAEMDARAQNNTNKISSRAEQVRNRTRNWFDNLRSNFV